MAPSVGLHQLAPYAAALDLLHKQFSPHTGQIAPGRALFHEGKKRIFLCLGRRFGKSVLMSYMAVRWALTKPNSPCYIVGPYLKQAREIFLHAGSLVSICPKPLIDGINLTEGRITFTNGSFVRVLGADDPDSLRGIRASIICADEVKDFRPEALDVLTPCLVDEDGPLILSGTPPEIAEHPFWALVREAQTNPDWAYFHGTSYDNPHLKAEVLDRERRKMEARGDLDVFIREYEARYVPGGKRAVFPMLEDAAHVFPYHTLRNRIIRQPDHWQYYCTLDPGTASCFAVTLSAVNPYTGAVYVMDEVYATNQDETSIGQIWPRVATKMRELYEPEGTDEPWVITVDEAATWARNELLDQFNVPSFPTKKASSRKADGISLLKDLLHKRKMCISERCVETLREMKGYMLDKRGYFVKANDHAIDTLRYTLSNANYTLNETVPPERLVIPEDERPRAFTPEQDYIAQFGQREVYLLDLLEAEEA